MSSRPKPVLPSPGNHWFILGKSSPFMAEQFRLVKYYPDDPCMVYLATFAP